MIGTVQRLGIVVPVYRGEHTLPGLIDELQKYRAVQQTGDGLSYRLDEVILVWDRGPDDSSSVIRRLAADHDWVRPLWLSRNFGQHPATVAGMAAAGADWIVTMDEDGQHDPAAIADLLDTAFRERTPLVYAAPTNAPPHSAARNAASSVVKRVLSGLLTDGTLTNFHSFRLMSGELGRSVAAFIGPDVYLDVALSWATAKPGYCPVAMRHEERAVSGYTFPRLLAHLWRLIVSSGTRPLRLVSLLGLVSVLLGVVGATLAIALRLAGAIDVEGWTSLLVVILFGGGLIMISLGIMAEYVGFGAAMSMGKPTYISASDPHDVFGPDVRDKSSHPHERSG